MFLNISFERVKSISSMPGCDQKKLLAYEAQLNIYDLLHVIAIQGLIELRELSINDNLNREFNSYIITDDHLDKSLKYYLYNLGLTYLNTGLYEIVLEEYLGLTVADLKDRLDLKDLATELLTDPLTGFRRFEFGYLLFYEIANSLFAFINNAEVSHFLENSTNEEEKFIDDICEEIDKILSQESLSLTHFQTTVVVSAISNIKGFSLSYGEARLFGTRAIRQVNEIRQGMSNMRKVVELVVKPGPRLNKRRGLKR